MSFDLGLFAGKLAGYRNQRLLDRKTVAAGTGLSVERIASLEEAKATPTGDEVLILADYFAVDYRFFISSEPTSAFDQTELLFRAHSHELSAEDRRSIQEALFLCECESYLQALLGKQSSAHFDFMKSGSFYKGHGQQAAASLRSHLGYDSHQVPSDVYRDFRRIGFHVFRRWFDNRGISGICIRHPVVGYCLLINYGEDPYRQRFTAAHEAAHAILDDDKEATISFTEWARSDLSEVRANSFASAYLMPPEFLRQIPDVSTWNQEKVVQWANHLKVSTEALSYALRDHGLIDAKTQQAMKHVRVPAEEKSDPELPVTLSPGHRKRREGHLKLGLSTYYVDLCVEAYRYGQISAGRLAEMLLTAPTGVDRLLRDFGG